MTHVNSSKWTATRHKFSFIALFSGAFSLVVALAGALLSIPSDEGFVNYFVKIFAAAEFVLVASLFCTMAVTALLRSIGSRRHSFRSTYAELFRSVEQTWFYIPLLAALAVYLVVGTS